jgi:hypothetical protein
MAYFDHLKLLAWPFSIVPRQQHCDFIAGRAQLRDDICAVLRGLSRRDTSSIHLIWSWLGAGKTHSLYYLMTEARELNKDAHVELYPIYSEFPKRARGFFDLYQSAILNLDRTLLIESILEATTSPEWAPRFRALSDANPDLSAAFRNLAMGNEYDQSIAIRWLRGDTLPIGEYRRLGISQRVATADQAVRIFSAAVELCDMAARSKGKQGFRIIWILDEYQRIARCSPSVAREINAGLHSLFNACPAGLTIIISFSGAPDAKRLPDWLSPELRDRIGATKVMILPPFQPAEALRFIAEVLAHFRISGSANTDRFFPFTEDACEYVISYLAKMGDLRPRIIMHAMNAILEAGDSQIEKEVIARINRDFAESVLREYVILADVEPDENN